MNKQFTASEVRELIKAIGLAEATAQQVLDQLGAFAGLLEAREKAQPPAASVPTLRYFIGGPKACAYVDKLEYVEAVITALCECTGDDRDDYTATDLADAQENPNG